MHLSRCIAQQSNTKLIQMKNGLFSQASIRHVVGSETCVNSLRLGPSSGSKPGSNRKYKTKLSTPCQLSCRTDLYSTVGSRTFHLLQFVEFLSAIIPVLRRRSSESDCGGMDNPAFEGAEVIFKKIINK